VSRIVLAWEVDNTGEAEGVDGADGIVVIDGIEMGGILFVSVVEVKLKLLLFVSEIFLVCRRAATCSAEVTIITKS